MFDGIPVKDKELCLGIPLVMGIVNVTPDSFSDGSVNLDPKNAFENFKIMLESGVDIVDIGGESSRPFAEPVSEKEEKRRVKPLLEMIAKEYPETIISIDTRKPEVAEMAVELGASIINDVSGFSDPKMIEVAAKYKLPVVLMHSQGEPKTMQIDPNYKDLIGEIETFFETKISILKKASINNIIIDPGIGFGKRMEDNLTILANIGRFKKFGYPILVGASRKSFISNYLEIENKNSLDLITGALSAYLISEGVSILRVHDVYSNAKILRLMKAIKECKI